MIFHYPLLYPPPFTILHTEKRRAWEIINVICMTLEVDVWSIYNFHTYQGPPSPFLGLPEQLEVKCGGQPLQCAYPGLRLGWRVRGGAVILPPPPLEIYRMIVSCNSPSLPPSLSQ